MLHTASLWLEVILVPLPGPAGGWDLRKKLPGTLAFHTDAYPALNQSQTWEIHRDKTWVWLEKSSQSSFEANRVEAIYSSEDCALCPPLSCSHCVDFSSFIFFHPAQTASVSKVLLLSWIHKVMFTCHVSSKTDILLMAQEGGELD